jgi:hypothetical protein
MWNGGSRAKCHGSHADEFFTSHAVHFLSWQWKYVTHLKLVSWMAFSYMYFYAEDKKYEESVGFSLQFVKYCTSPNLRRPFSFCNKKIRKHIFVLRNRVCRLVLSVIPHNRIPIYSKGPKARQIIFSKEQYLKKISPYDRAKTAIKNIKLYILHTHLKKYNIECPSIFHSP